MPAHLLSLASPTPSELATGILIALCVGAGMWVGHRIIVRKWDIK